MQKSKINLKSALFQIHQDLNGKLEKLAGEQGLYKQAIFAAAIAAEIQNRAPGAPFLAPYRGPASYRLSIYYPVELHDQVMALAAAAGATQSAVLTTALKNYLEG